ncbi:MAG: putative cytosol aminopeptidase [Lysobacteraceae bacterium]|nr:MAG: putative cytosol aminopeptidase [Xanthomonadaceae bacterium]
MKFSLSTASALDANTECLIVGLFKSGSLSGAAAAVDGASNGAITALRDSGDINTGLGQTTLLPRIDGISSRLLVVGLGERDKLTEQGFDNACGAAVRRLGSSPVKQAHSFLTEVEVGSNQWRTRQAAIAATSAAYRYERTRKIDSSAPAPLAELTLHGSSDLEAAMTQGHAIGIGINRAKELGNLPPNICTPAYLKSQAEDMAAELDKVSLETLDDQQMEALGMGALLGVGQGSVNRPYLIVLSYNGGKDGDRPHALVGKGITFDTGGISLKPGPAMDEMKFDMCGAAGVLGTFEAIARMKLAINLVCVVPAVENMPDGKSYRPGDVLTSMSGKTIEVLNTDAEGRLILCDALTYVQKFEPVSIIDVATLTGACVIALGAHASGIMTHHDDLADELLQAGNSICDRGWRLPLWDDYQKQIDSPFADMANIGGKPAGTITAGCFLARFTEGCRWAHIDIAGTAWHSGKNKGATGRPVSLLSQYLIDQVAS